MCKVRRDRDKSQQTTGCNQRKSWFNKILTHKGVTFFQCLFFFPIMLVLYLFTCNGYGHFVVFLFLPVHLPCLLQFPSFLWVLICFCGDVFVSFIYPVFMLPVLVCSLLVICFTIVCFICSWDFPVCIPCAFLIISKFWIILLRCAL